jgi:hypothetical protein
MSSSFGKRSQSLRGCLAALNARGYCFLLKAMDVFTEETSTRTTNFGSIL